MFANEPKKHLNFPNCFGRYANFSYICKNKNINQIMEKKLTLSMLLVSIMFCFSGCNSEIKKVESHLDQMLASPVILKFEQMQCRKVPLAENTKDYRMVVFVDSTECTPCSLSKLRFWNPLIKESRMKKISIDYIFIVAPKQSEMEDINLELGITDLQSSIYLDTAYVFRNQNPSIPNERKYHSFLLDKNDRIVFVGSPVDNDKIKAIYGKTIGVK